MKASDYLLLVVDVQSDFFDHLQPKRRVSFPRQIEAFVKKARPHMPIIWAGYGSHDQKDSLTPGIHTDSPETPWERAAKETFARKMGLPPEAAIGHDSILIKTRDDCFKESQLTSHIRQHHPAVQNVVVIGMNTTFCITATLRGATKDGFKTIALPDLLADNNDHRPLERQPKAHQEWLRTDPSLFNVIHGANPQLSFMMGDDFLRQMRAKEKPAPQDATPAHSRQNLVNSMLQRSVSAARRIAGL